MTKDLLIVTPAPHFRDGASTTGLMLNVAAALIPAVVASALVFGPRALVLEAACVAACVFFEWLFRKVCKRTNTIGDCSAVVTGLLLAFNLPVGMPIWMAVLGCAAAILVAKQLFGGIGQNFANPALVGRVVLLVSFGAQMTTWADPHAYLPGIEAVSGATPLALIKHGAAIADLPPMLNMLTGVRGGCIGETCVLALVIGGVYLMAKRVITPTIPLTYIATVIVLSFAFGLNPAYQVVSGGLLLGAFFMATDYSTSPTTESGKVIFAIGCGVITMAIRAFGSYPEGVSFSILLMNILTPLIDRATRTKPFGGIVK